MVVSEKRVPWQAGCRLRSSRHWWPHPTTAPRTPLTTIPIHSRDQRKPPFCYTILGTLLLKLGWREKDTRGWGCILQFLVACARLQIYELCYLWCYLISCVAYTCCLRHYALTIVIKISLSPFHRQMARVSWRPHPNPLVSLSSQSQFQQQCP